MLNDIYPVIIKVWDYLISATNEQILNLPNLKFGDNLDDFPQLTQTEKYLLGFVVSQGVQDPRKTVTSRTAGLDSHGQKRWNNTTALSRWKRQIIKNISRIRHWKTSCKSYLDLPDESDVTLYVDPPYEFGGECYIHHDIDFKQLHEWILSRKAKQIIVCENTKATWGPFVPLVQLHGSFKTTTEAIWYIDKTNSNLNTFFTEKGAENAK